MFFLPFLFRILSGLSDPKELLPLSAYHCQSGAWTLHPSRNGRNWRWINFFIAIERFGNRENRKQQDYLDYEVVVSEGLCYHVSNPVRFSFTIVHFIIIRILLLFSKEIIDPASWFCLLSMYLIIIIGHKYIGLFQQLF